MNLTSPKNWKTVKLGEIVSLSQGVQVPMENQYPENAPNRIRFIRIVDFTKDSIEEVRYIDFPGEKYMVNDQDLVMIRYGSQTAGKIAKGFSGVIANNTFKISPDEEFLNRDYLYLFLSQKNIYNYFQSLQSSSTMPAITFGMVKSIEIPLPSLEEQKEIAAILGSLDDKIELLRRENKTLESIAQALFREWFIEFRFPGYEGVKVVDGVPEGWKVGKLGDVLKLPSGFAFKSGTFSKDGKYRLVTITNVKNGYFESKTAEGINELPKNMPEYCHLGTRDILLSLTGEVGRVCIVIGENYVLNQRVSKIEPLQLRDKAFVYFLMRSKEISDQMQSIAVGAVQQNLSPVKALDIESIIPDEKHLQLFSETISPMFDKLISNIQEIQTLSTLRDDLLNKIFSV